MEPIIQTCLTHNRFNEIYCVACNTYLCPECLSFHKTDTHKPKYLNVMQYAPAKIIPQIEELVDNMHEGEKTPETDAKELFAGIGTVAPLVTDAANVYTLRANQLKAIVGSLVSYGKQGLHGSMLENIKKGIDNDKTILERAIKEKRDIDVVRLTQRIEDEAALAENREGIPEMLEQLKTAMKILKEMALYRSIMVSAKLLSTKCGLYVKSMCIGDWKCDKKYLTSKMTLTEDGLTYGNCASNGYPAIIGTIPFDSGLYAYEVIPTDLDCSGKEGFGIIELAKYIKIFEADKVTPKAFEDMIGFFYKADVKGMKSEKIADMKMKEKYVVKVNIPELYVTITGPGLLLKGDLKAGVAYAPCFSCGCRNNKIEIRPLDNFAED